MRCIAMASPDSGMLTGATKEKLSTEEPSEDGDNWEDEHWEDEWCNSMDEEQDWWCSRHSLGLREQDCVLCRGCRGLSRGLVLRVMRLVRTRSSLASASEGSAVGLLNRRLSSVSTGVVSCGDSEHVLIWLCCLWHGRGNMELFLAQSCNLWEC